MVTKNKKEITRRDFLQKAAVASGAVLVPKLLEAGETTTRPESPITDDHAKEHLRKGMKHLQLKNYKRAISEFRLATLQNPEILDAYVGAGDSHIALADKDGEDSLVELEQAASAYEFASILDPLNEKIKDKLSKLNLKIGHLHMDECRYSEAMECFNTVPNTATDTKDIAEAHIGMGRMYMRTKLWGRSVKEFEAAVQTNSRDPRGHYLLGHSQYRQAKEDKKTTVKEREEVGRRALMECGEAIRLDDRNPEAYLYKGMLHIELKEWGDAFKELQFASKFLDPKDSNIRIQLGRVYLGRREYNGALAQFDGVLKDNREKEGPNVHAQNADAHFYKGNVFHRMGIKDKTNRHHLYRQAVSEVLDAKTEDPEAYTGKETDKLLIHLNKQIAQMDRMKDPKYLAELKREEEERERRRREYHARQEERKRERARRTYRYGPSRYYSPHFRLWYYRPHRIRHHRHYRRHR